MSTGEVRFTIRNVIVYFSTDILYRSDAPGGQLGKDAEAAPCPLASKPG
jgi:hypothetical protein